MSSSDLTKPFDFIDLGFEPVEVSPVQPEVDIAASPSIEESQLDAAIQEVTTPVLNEPKAVKPSSLSGKKISKQGPLTRVMNFIFQRSTKEKEEAKLEKEREALRKESDSIKEQLDEIKEAENQFYFNESVQTQLDSYREYEANLKDLKEQRKVLISTYSRAEGQNKQQLLSELKENENQIAEHHLILDSYKMGFKEKFPDQFREWQALKKNSKNLERQVQEIETKLSSLPIDIQSLTLEDKLKEIAIAVYSKANRNKNPQLPEKGYLVAQFQKKGYFSTSVDWPGVYKEMVTVCKQDPFLQIEVQGRIVSAKAVLQQIQKQWHASIQKTDPALAEEITHILNNIRKQELTDQIDSFHEALYTLKNTYKEQPGGIIFDEKQSKYQAKSTSALTNKDLILIDTVFKLLETLKEATQPPHNLHSFEIEEGEKMTFAELLQSFRESPWGQELLNSQEAQSRDLNIEYAAFEKRVSASDFEEILKLQTNLQAVADVVSQVVKSHQEKTPLKPKLVPPKDGYNFTTEPLHIGGKIGSEAMEAYEAILNACQDVVEAHAELRVNVQYNSKQAFIKTILEDLHQTEWGKAAYQKSNHQIKALADDLQSKTALRTRLADLSNVAENMMKETSNGNPVNKPFVNEKGQLGVKPRAQGLTIGQSEGSQKALRFMFKTFQEAEKSILFFKGGSRENLDGSYLHNARQDFLNIIKTDWGRGAVKAAIDKDPTFAQELNKALFQEGYFTHLQSEAVDRFTKSSRDSVKQDQKAILEAKMDNLIGATQNVISSTQRIVYSFDRSSVKSPLLKVSDDNHFAVENTPKNVPARDILHDVFIMTDFIQTYQKEIGPSPTPDQLNKLKKAIIGLHKVTQGKNFKNALDLPELGQKIREKVKSTIQQAIEKIPAKEIDSSIVIILRDYKIPIESLKNVDPQVLNLQANLQAVANIVSELVKPNSNNKPIHEFSSGVYTFTVVDRSKKARNENKPVSSRKAYEAILEICEEARKAELRLGISTPITYINREGKEIQGASIQEVLSELHQTEWGKKAFQNSLPAIQERARYLQLPSTKQNLNVRLQDLSDVVYDMMTNQIESKPKNKPKLSEKGTLIKKERQLSEAGKTGSSTSSQQAIRFIFRILEDSMYSDKRKFAFFDSKSTSPVARLENAKQLFLNLIRTDWGREALKNAIEGTSSFSEDLNEVLLSKGYFDHLKSNVIEENFVINQTSAKKIAREILENRMTEVAQSLSSLDPNTQSVILSFSQEKKSSELIGDQNHFEIQDNNLKELDERALALDIVVLADFIQTYQEETGPDPTIEQQGKLAIAIDGLDRMMKGQVMQEVLQKDPALKDKIEPLVQTTISEASKLLDKAVRQQLENSEKTVNTDPHKALDPLLDMQSRPALKKLIEGSPSLKSQFDSIYNKGIERVASNMRSAFLSELSQVNIEEVKLNAKMMSKSKEEKEKGIPHLTKNAEILNHVSSFVNQRVLTHQDPRRRAAELEKFIKCAQMAVKNKDYITGQAIYSALASSALYRLSKTRELLSEDAKQALQELEVRYSASGVAKFKEDFNKTLEESKKNSSVVPNLPMHLGYINKTLEDSETTKANLETAETKFKMAEAKTNGSLETNYKGQMDDFDQKDKLLKTKKEARAKMVRASKVTPNEKDLKQLEIEIEALDNKLKPLRPLRDYYAKLSQANEEEAKELLYIAKKSVEKNKEIQGKADGIVKEVVGSVTSMLQALQEMPIPKEDNSFVATIKDVKGDFTKWSNTDDSGDKNLAYTTSLKLEPPKQAADEKQIKKKFSSKRFWWLFKT